MADQTKVAAPFITNAPSVAAEPAEPADKAVPAVAAVAAVPVVAPSPLFIIAVVVVLLVGLLLALSATVFKQIFANFGSYRCNPLMMPFAGMFGYNATENFQFCLNGILQGRLGEVFSPVFKMLGTFGSTLEMVVNAALGLRNVFTNFLLTVNGFIANVTRRIQSLMLEVRMSMLKMKELMGKVYGTMYAVIWMGTSGLTAANNVANNDLVKFMMEFCFAPDTAIQLADGSWTTLDSLQIGDRLLSVLGRKAVGGKAVGGKAVGGKAVGGKAVQVTSLFRFDGSRTPMVRIGDVVVSAYHYMEHDGEMKEASEHPDAIPLPSIPLLCCLNVTGHRFLVGRAALLAADYDEDESDEVIENTQALALKALNGFPTSSSPVLDYSLGLDDDLEVAMASGAWKRIADIGVGDVVAQSGVVRGTVIEQCAAVVATPCGPMAAGQLVFVNLDWKRAGHVWKPLGEPRILRHLITERCGVLEVRSAGGKSMYIRDYREVPLPEMEDAYAAKLKSQSNVANVV